MRRPALRTISLIALSGWLLAGGVNLALTIHVAADHRPAAPARVDALLALDHGHFHAEGTPEHDHNLTAPARHLAMQPPGAGSGWLHLGAGDLSRACRTMQPRMSPPVEDLGRAGPQLLHRSCVLLI